MLLDTNYVFFGTPEFAAIILEKLMTAGFVPQAIVCNPDKPVGRKKIITAPPVKLRIMNYESGIKDKIEILQPEKLDSFLISHFSNLKLDFFVVAAYAKIIPKEVLGIPKLGSIGVHPSLLPKHRGSSPIQAAIIDDDAKTGVTLYLMDEKVDHGPIIRNEKLEMRNEDYTTLSKKLAELGGELLIKTLPDFIAGKIKPIPQNESEATYTKKFKISDGYVEWEALVVARNKGGELAMQIERKIRALNPEPGVWTINPPAGGSKRLKLLSAELTAENKLKLKKIQLEGKKSQEIE